MLQICQKDRVPHSVGAASCPQCGHTEFWLEGQEPPVDVAADEVAAVEPAAALTATQQEADLQAAQARQRVKVKAEPKE